MKTHSAAWYDSMYNNRALVPDHAAHFADWSKTSADARASLKCCRGVAFNRRRQGNCKSSSSAFAKHGHTSVHCG